MGKAPGRWQFGTVWAFTYLSGFQVLHPWGAWLPNAASKSATTQGQLGKRKNQPTKISTTNYVRNFGAPTNGNSLTLKAFCSLWWRSAWSEASSASPHLRAADGGRFGEAPGASGRRKKTQNGILASDVFEKKGFMILKHPTISVKIGENHLIIGARMAAFMMYIP